MLVRIYSLLKYFSILPNGQTGCGTHTVSFLMGTGVPAGGSKGRGVLLTTEIFLVPTLKRGEAIFILFACMVFTRKHLLSITANEHVGLDAQYAK